VNPVPGYLRYAFREPGGLKIVADGACSMGYWAVKDSREIEIRHHAFGGKSAPRDPAEAATVLFITGARGKPQVSLNGKDAELRPWKDGWLLPLGGAVPADAELAARLRGAEAGSP
jgi:hypothetical protein